MSTQALKNTLICPLSEFGLIRFTGEDAQTFLQGQLSSDIRQINEQAIQYSSHSSAKGRMLGSFLLFRDGSDYLMQLSADLRTPLHKRLSMYILRSKVRATPDDHALLGITGPQAGELIHSALGIDVDAGSCRKTGELIVLCLSEQRFEIVAPPAHAADIQHKLLAAGGINGDANAWRMAEIRAGIGWITQATQEEFVAQMTNLDLLQGISFNKGCYTGQEIIARTQYLGKLKRRLYRVSVNTDIVNAGDAIFSPEMQGQASGRVVLAAQAENHQWEALVVAQMSSIEHGLHLTDPSGPPLTILPLPYPID